MAKMSRREFSKSGVLAGLALLTGDAVASGRENRRVQLGFIGIDGRGGGIVATADAATYNEWRRIRVESGLKEITGISKLALKGGVDELAERVFFERGLTRTQGAGGREPEYDGKCRGIISEKGGAYTYSS